MISMKYKLALAFFLPLTLIGCGGSPSAGDIKSAFESQLDATKDMSESMLGGEFGSFMDGFMPTVNDIDDVHCEEIRDAVYLCDFLISGEMNGVEFEDQPSQGQFRKTDKGWMAL